MSGLGRGSRKRGENHRACSLLHYRAIDQFGQVIDVLVSQRRDLAATHRFFTQALAHGRSPTEVTTDRALAGHAFIQNIRRGHYQLGVDEAATLRVAAAFDELTLAI